MPASRISSFTCHAKTAAPHMFVLEFLLSAVTYLLDPESYYFSSPPCVAPCFECYHFLLAYHNNSLRSSIVQTFSSTAHSKHTHQIILKILY